MNENAHLEEPNETCDCGCGHDHNHDDFCECGHDHHHHGDACDCGCEDMPQLGLAQLVGVEGEPVYTLAEIFALLEDEEVKLAIESYDPSEEEDLGLDQLSREELIARAVEVMSSPDIHVMNLRSLQSDMREDYLWIVEEGVYECSADAAAARLDFLINAEDEQEIANMVREIERAATIEALAGEMIVFPFLHDGLITFVMPNEIREACKSIATEEFLTYVAEVEQIIAYIDAATNLYGVIAVEDLIDLIATYEPDMSASDAAAHVVEILEVDRLWPHSVENGFVSHELFRDGTGLGEQMAYELLSVASNTPRYQPDRETFLDYANPDFDEENFEADLLFELLVDLFPEYDDPEAAYQVVQFVQQCARQGMRNEIIIETLFEDMLPQPLANEGQASLLIKQIAKLVHTTRSWPFSGHTPEEAESLK